MDEKWQEIQLFVEKVTGRKLNEWQIALMQSLLRYSCPSEAPSGESAGTARLGYTIDDSSKAKALINNRFGQEADKQCYPDLDVHVIPHKNCVLR